MAVFSAAWQSRNVHGIYTNTGRLEIKSKQIRREAFRATQIFDYRSYSGQSIVGEWVGDKPPGGDGSTSGGESNRGEENFRVTSDSGAKSGEEKETDNVCVSGEPMVMSLVTGMQPCPLVFFLNCWGDVDTFASSGFECRMEKINPFERAVLFFVTRMKASIVPSKRHP
jgi:hypothetical protein